MGVLHTDLVPPGQTIHPPRPAYSFTRIMFASILALGAFASSVYGHTIFQEMYVNGVDQGHINGIRVPTYDGVRSLCTSACPREPTISLYNI